MKPIRQMASMLRMSDFHGQTCGVGAQVCESGAEDCDGFGDDDMMQRCAEAYLSSKVLVVKWLRLPDIIPHTKNPAL